MSPTSAVLAATFGHGYRRPLLAARLKLAGFCAGALSLGVLLSSNLPQLSKLGNYYSPVTWMTTAVFAVQFMTVASLTLSSNIVARNRTSLLLTTLPLRMRQLKFLLLLPSLAIACCSLALTVPILANICLHNDLKLPFFILSVCIGSYSAIGLAFSHANPWLCKGLAFIVLAGEYRLWGLIREDNARWAILLFAIILVILCALATHAGSIIIRFSRRSNVAKPVSRNNLPAWGWFLKKLWRYVPLQQSLSVTLVFAIILSAIILKYGAFSSSLALMVAQVLAASLTSDIRALARTFRPAEIYDLRGTNYFFRHLVMAGIVASYLVLMPVEIAAVSHGVPIISLLTHILSGASIGLLVGFWLTPRPGDVSAQLAANLACVGIAVLISWSLTSIAYLSLLHCGLAVLGLGMGFIIEYKRNALTWRKHDN